LWTTHSDSALPTFRYWTFCINRSISESRLIEVPETVGCVTRLPLLDEKLDWPISVPEESDPPEPQFVPAVNLRTSQA
jgi:hypothetical protein